MKTRKITRLVVALAAPLVGLISTASAFAPQTNVIQSGVECWGARTSQDEPAITRDAYGITTSSASGQTIICPLREASYESYEQVTQLTDIKVLYSGTKPTCTVATYDRNGGYKASAILVDDTLIPGRLKMTGTLQAGAASREIHLGCWLTNGQRIKGYESTWVIPAITGGI